MSARARPPAPPSDARRPPRYRRPGDRAERALRLGLLAAALARREWQSRYRRSLLGPAWSFLKPLLTMGVLVLLKEAVGISSGGFPYAVFACAAVVPWTLFSTGLGTAASSVFSNAALLRKVDAPREAFPLAAVVVSLIDFCIAAGILLALMAAHGVALGPRALLAFPLAALTAAFTYALGLALAAVGTYQRDVIYGLPFFIQMGLLVSPVAYPTSLVPAAWLPIYALNPMVGIVEGFRAVLLRDAWPDPALLLPAALVTALTFFLGWPLFRRVSPYFADVL